MKGGKQGGFELKDWAEWARSLAYAPVVVDYKVALISDIINNPRKKANYAKATLEYLEASQIPE